MSTAVTAARSVQQILNVVRSLAPSRQSVEELLKIIQTDVDVFSIRDLTEHDIIDHILLGPHLDSGLDDLVTCIGKRAIELCRLSEKQMRAASESEQTQRVTISAIEANSESLRRAAVLFDIAAVTTLGAFIASEQAEGAARAVEKLRMTFGRETSTRSGNVPH